LPQRTSSHSIDSPQAFLISIPLAPIFPFPIIALMPRLPFIFARETERAAVDAATRIRAKRNALYEMIDAVLRVNQTQKITPAGLKPILRGFKFTDEAVWSRAAFWLAKLYSVDPAISADIDQLASHRMPIVRFTLCSSLGRFPKAIAVPILRRLLFDKSLRVRRAVLGIAIHDRHTELIPDLQRLLKHEKFATRRRSIREAIAWLGGKSFSLDGLKVRVLENGDIEAI
jgi:HEAT repeat protein